MRKNNRKCIVCGKIYTYCQSCSEFSHLEPWHAIYHDENCKNIFEAASDYLQGAITKEEAKEKLDKCDLTNKENFHKVILDAINQVYESDVKANKKVTKQVVENKPNEQVNKTEDK